MRLPSWVRMDAERGLLWAYYRYVLKAEAPYFGALGDNGLVLHTRLGDTVIGMDFSSFYDGVRRHTARDRWEQRMKDFSPALWQGDSCLYEVWCFGPPGDALRELMRESDRPVQAALIEPQMVRDRIRDTVMAIPAEPPEDEPAFVQSALMIRRALALMEEETTSPYLT